MSMIEQTVVSIESFRFCLPWPVEFTNFRPVSSFKAVLCIVEMIMGIKCFSNIKMILRVWSANVQNALCGLTDHTGLKMCKRCAINFCALFSFFCFICKVSVSCKFTTAYVLFSYQMHNATLCFYSCRNGTKKKP